MNCACFNLFSFEMYQHLEHFWEVCFGSTFISSPPFLFSLYSSNSKSFPSWLLQYWTIKSSFCTCLHIRIFYRTFFSCDLNSFELLSSFLYLLLNMLFCWIDRFIFTCICKYFYTYIYSNRATIIWTYTLF
jgi:hypothetical protein